MSTQPQVDYDALAKQYGATSSTIDYDALAKQHGAISSTSGDQISAQPKPGTLAWKPVSEDAPKEKPGFWAALGSDLKGLLTPSAQNPYPGMGQEQKVEATAQSAQEDQARKAAGYSGAYRAIAPVAQSLGVNVPGMEQAAREGNPSAVMGHAVAAAAPYVAGPLAEAGIKKIGPAVQSGMQSAAERMYQSALKPSTTIPSPKVAQIVRTGLDAGIPVSEKGITKLSQLSDDLNRAIEDQIASNPNAPVNKFKVASRLNDTASKFSNQVSPTADLEEIGKVGNDFLGTQPGEITAQNAQALKRGTYQQLGARAYGELKGATMEAQKALARGLKEELQNIFPEIGGLNSQEARFMNLDDVLQKAVQRESNKQIFKIGSPVIGGVGVKAITGSGPAGLAVAALKAVLDDPVSKSRIAMALTKGSRGSLSGAAAIAKVSAYSAALGNAAIASNPNDHTSGQQP